jgi:hypothetical protein
MATKRGKGDSQADAVSEALDQLYGAPLERFVPSRRELVASLRASGDIAASKLVASAEKPTRTAWALNQVARRRPELIRALFEARDRANQVQKQGDAEQVRASVREFRDRLTDAVNGAREAANETGFSFNAAQARRIAETLQAAGGAGSEARASVLAGRLAHDVGLEDPFAGLEAGPPPGRGRQDRQAQQARQERQERTERLRAIEQVRERVAALERQAAEARAAARHANALARRAQSDAERADRAVAEAEKDLDQARAELQRLRK